MEHIPHKSYDVIIIGAGPVGSNLAIALGKADFSVAVIDKVDPEKILHASYDGRTTAISFGSKQILDDLQIWDPLSLDAQSIKEIFVSTQGQKGYMHYDEHCAGGHPMGYIVENRLFRKALFERIQSLDSIDLFAPEGIQDFTQSASDFSLTLENGTTLTSKLCVAADGRGSFIRNKAGFKTKHWDYHHKALVFAVEHTRPHHSIAYEHFMHDGPLAFLPMQGNCSSVVWSMSFAAADRMLALSDDDFNQELQQQFGCTLGDLEVQGKKWCYPLSATISVSPVKNRVALVGDAAHGIHPVAGQGFNLGLRDSAVLAEQLIEARNIGLDIGSKTILKNYEKSRRIDTWSMTAMTDGIVRLFSNSSRSLSILRSFGLGLTNQVTPLKKLFTRHAMGMRKTS